MTIEKTKHVLGVMLSPNESKQSSAKVYALPDASNYPTMVLCSCYGDGPRELFYKVEANAVLGESSKKRMPAKMVVEKIRLQTRHDYRRNQT